MGKQYEITDDISKANYWISYPDEESCVKEWIIPGKKYELIKIAEQWDDGIREEEYFIKSEDGFYSMYYICHKGDFVVQNVL